MIAIIHADEALVAVAKPSGLAAHRSRLVGSDDDYLVDAAREITGRPLYLAHRLDRATSGLVLLGADKAVTASLGRQFMERRVEKSYLAVARGFLATTGVIDHALDAPGKPQPKPARTAWRLLATGTLDEALGRYELQRYSLLVVQPETGRYQQIRRHFKHISHHLIGDTTHGRGEHNRLFRMRFGVHRLLLHAWRLVLEHPVSGERLRLEAPLDAEFGKVIEAFSWSGALPPPDPLP